MSELDHLGGALREQLRALAADVNPSDELLARIDVIPQTAHVDVISEAATVNAFREAKSRARWRDRVTRRRIAFTAPFPVAAIVTAVVAFGGATPTASLGTDVTWLPNGQVRMPDRDVARVAFANSVFHRTHFPATVIPMTTSCTDRNWSYTAEYLHPTIVDLYIPNRGLKGWVYMLAAKQVGPNELVLAKGRFRRGTRLPTCASTHGWGSGMVGYKSWPAPKGS